MLSINIMYQGVIDMNDNINQLLKEYRELFNSGYPSIQLGLDENMISKCIRIGIIAEDLYADRLKKDREY